MLCRQTSRSSSSVCYPVCFSLSLSLSLSIYLSISLPPGELRTFEKIGMQSATIILSLPSYVCTIPATEVPPPNTAAHLNTSPVHLVRQERRNGKHSTAKQRNFVVQRHSVDSIGVCPTKKRWSMVPEARVYRWWFVQASLSKGRFVGMTYIAQEMVNSSVLPSLSVARLSVTELTRHISS